MDVDIDDLYRTYGPMLLRRCRRILRDEAEAVDAMHDVFVEILRRRHSLRDGSRLALLVRTATNVCLNRLRTRRRHPEDRDDELLLAIANQGSPSPESQALTQQLLDRLFDRSAESTRYIAVLHYVDRLTLREVARHVGLSVSGVRWRLRNLLAEVPRLQEEESHA